MSLATQTETSTREMSKIGRISEELADAANIAVHLPPVLVAYMTIHEQFRYPRILRVNDDTKTLQTKLGEMMRAGGVEVDSEADSATAMERKKAQARAAIDHLKIAACLYAPFSGYHASMHIFQPRPQRPAGRPAQIDTAYADMGWVGPRRAA